VIQHAAPHDPAPDDDDLVPILHALAAFGGREGDAAECNNGVAMLQRLGSLVP
jgi:hypothetical protein